jgi:hypothetical protein
VNVQAFKVLVGKREKERGNLGDPVIQENNSKMDFTEM